MSKSTKVCNRIPSYQGVLRYRFVAGMKFSKVRPVQGHVGTRAATAPPAPAATAAGGAAARRRLPREEQEAREGRRGRRQERRAQGWPPSAGEVCCRAAEAGRGQGQAEGKAASPRRASAAEVSSYEENVATKAENGRHGRRGVTRGRTPRTGGRAKEQRGTAPIRAAPCSPKAEPEAKHEDVGYSNPVGESKGDAGDETGETFELPWQAMNLTIWMRPVCAIRRCSSAADEAKEGTPSSGSDTEIEHRELHGLPFPPALVWPRIVAPGPCRQSRQTAERKTREHQLAVESLRRTRLRASLSF